ncbi:hypothetical protein KHP62_18390 [Rhodobacteraceae bacterium NNCM2]|nr:hypothetical protein [Coraliihabitans acroporae]
MARIIVHIGGAKCGSTAIQLFLQANRRRLATANYIAPDTDLAFGTHLPANQVWFFQGLIVHPSDQQAREKQASNFSKLRSGLFNLIEKQKAKHQPWAGSVKSVPTILLSAENLSNPNQIHRHFADLAKDFDIEVILYIRRQEDAFMSGWQQWFMKTEDSLDRWIQESSGFFTDWRKTIETWKTVGEGKLTVRLFDRSVLVGGDVVKDYCDTLGFVPARYDMPKADANVTYGAHIAQLMHDCRETFVDTHDIFFEHMLYRMKIDAAHKHPGEVIFTREQIEAVRARYAEDNAWIKENYFPDLDRDELFLPLDYDKLSMPSQDVMNRRNLEVLDAILENAPAMRADFPTIDPEGDPEAVRREIAAATIPLIYRLKAEANEK